MKRLFALLLLLLIPLESFSVDFDDLTIATVPMQMVDAGGSSASNLAINSTLGNDTLCLVFQCSEAITITKVGFRYGARTGTIPANAYKATLEGISATDGNCDNSDVGGGSPTAAPFSPPSDATWDGTVREVTLTNSYACTRGQLLGISIRYNTGTIDGTNFSSFTRGMSTNMSATSFPYAAYVTDGGAVTKDSTLVPFLYASASKYYGQPVKAVTKANFSQDDSPDEYGLAFQLDCDWVTTYTVKGIFPNSRTPAAGKTVDLNFYSNTTELMDLTVDSDRLGSNTQNGSYLNLLFDDTTLDTLNCDTEYIAAWAPSSTTGEVTNLVVYEVQTANHLQAFPGGTEFHLVTRTNAGAWTSVTTSVPAMLIKIGDWTPPTGGGGARGSLINWGIN